MNKSELVADVAGQLGYSKAETHRLIDAWIEGIAHHLAIGNRVVIRGLGSFGTREVAGHRGHRPRDGEALEIPPKRQVTFRVADGMRQALREGGR